MGHKAADDGSQSTRSGFHSAGTHGSPPNARGVPQRVVHNTERHFPRSQFDARYIFCVCVGGDVMDLTQQGNSANAMYAA